MKRLLWLFATTLVVFIAILPALNAEAASTNLISNPSVETVNPSDTTLPLNWQTDKWGTNATTFTYNTNAGHTGTHSLYVATTQYADGDAKWYFNPVAVQPNTTYTFSDFYKSSIRTEVLAQYIDAQGSSTYNWLAGADASTSWKQLTTTFSTPTNATSMTVLQILDGVGNIQTDDYSLMQQPALSVVSLTAPSAGMVNGTVAVSASATGGEGIAGVQFKLNGVNLGSEDTAAPYQVSWDSMSIANGQQSLTAVARGKNGSNTTSAAINVTVNNLTPAGQNIIPNPSVESPNGSKPTNWQGTRSTGNTGQFTYLSTGAHTGSRALKTTITQYTRGDAAWSYTSQPVEGGKLYEFSDYYKATVNTEVWAHIIMGDGSEQWSWVGTAFHSQNWNHFDQQFAMPAGAVQADVYHTIFAVGSLTTDDYKLVEYSPLGFNRPLVSITFDDALRSTYVNGLPLLQKYNLVSTQYFLSGYTTDPYYMTPAMMQAFAAAGHEVGSHTVTHPDLTTLTSTQQNQELKDSQNQLLSMLGVKPLDFASPHGAYNSQVLSNIKKYYRSHRSVDLGFNSKDNFDTYNIKVQNVVISTTAAQIAQWVTQAQSDHSWLVLVYHSVDDPANVVDSTWDTTPADLDTHFAAIKASNVQVVTVSQALDEIIPQL